MFYLIKISITIKSLTQTKFYWNMDFSIYKFIILKIHRVICLIMVSIANFKIWETVVTVVKPIVPKLNVKFYWKINFPFHFLHKILLFLILFILWAYLRLMNNYCGVNNLNHDQIMVNKIILNDIYHGQAMVNQ